jgi:hypothetical protein
MSGLLAVQFLFLFYLHYYFIAFSGIPFMGWAGVYIYENIFILMLSI